MHGRGLSVFLVGAGAALLCAALGPSVVARAQASSGEPAQTSAGSGQGRPPDGSPQGWQGRGGGRRRGQGGGGMGGGRYFPPPKGAWGVATLILGCPTASSVRLSVRPASDIEAYVEYDRADAAARARTAMQSMKGGVPTLLTLGGLAANAQYTYRLGYRAPGQEAFQRGPEYRFHTARASGSAFQFEVMGDSHPERTPRQNLPELYEQTLTAAAKDRPDFFITMGDDFSVDTLNELTAATVDGVYTKQLPYLGLVGCTAPLFLVNGNHEQAAACNLNGTADNVAVWAQNARNRHFPQPEPDGFYTGDTEQVKHIGLLRDYYAWTWGDALFVVIDPYWHSPVPVDNVLGDRGGKTRDLWSVTLGEVQYRWLKRTLEGSHARYKLVFAHHVLGTGRGGVERAGLYEWGGQDQRSDWEFGTRRPGWELPIHQLMVKNGVTIFFQGHDHLFCHQTLDGVVYQTLAEPGDASYTLYNRDAYTSGDALPNSGRVRVTVSPQKVHVEYVRSYLPADATNEHPDGEVAFAYDVPARPGQKH